MVLVIAVVVFFVCMRKKKRKGRSRFDLEDVGRRVDASVCKKALAR